MWTMFSSSSLFSLASLTSLDLTGAWMTFFHRSCKSNTLPFFHQQTDFIGRSTLLVTLVGDLLSLVPGLLDALVPLVSSLLATVTGLLGLGALSTLLGLAL